MVSPKGIEALDEKYVYIDIKHANDIASEKVQHPETGEYIRGVMCPGGQHEARIRNKAP